VQPDAIFVVQCSIDRRAGDDANLIVERIIPLDQLDQSLTRGLKLRIDQRHHSEDTIKRTYEIVRGYPGPCRLELELVLDDGQRVQMKSNKVRVEINPQLCGRLEELLGAGKLEMVVDRKDLTRKSPPANKRQWRGRG
jgi:DNA polymerase-3 subunit alpha